LPVTVDGRQSSCGHRHVPPRSGRIYKAVTVAAPIAKLLTEQATGRQLLLTGLLSNNLTVNLLGFLVPLAAAIAGLVLTAITLSLLVITSYWCLSVLFIHFQYGDNLVPTASLRAPETAYGAPEASYGPPEAPYEAPESSYAAPETSHDLYGSPLGPPAVSYDPVQALIDAVETKHQHDASYAAPEASKDSYGSPFAPPEVAYAVETKHTTHEDSYNTIQLTELISAPRPINGSPLGNTEESYEAPNEADEDTYGAPSSNHYRWVLQ
jgi:hypothetical protein